MSRARPILQGFFTDRLIRQRQASPHTIAAYRDTCRLLLAFTSGQAGKQPCQLDIADLDAPLITAFLTHLETGRANTARTRNARLAAIHSLFRYAALHAPEHAAVISRVLAIPPKRSDRAIVSFLTAAEIDALLAAPGQDSWLGRRDRALLLVAVQTGLRVSELTGLTAGDVHLGPGAARPLPRQGPQRPCHPADPARPSQSCGTGSPSAAASPPTRCSPPGPGAVCPATPSNASSPSTPPQPQRPARPSAARTSPRTCCGIMWMAGLCGWQQHLRW